LKIRSVKLENFRAFSGKAPEIILNDKLTVFLGVNGAGKSTVLDTISIVLSRVISRIRYSKSTGTAINDTDFSIGRTKVAYIELKTDTDKVWSVRKTNTPSKVTVAYDKEYIDAIAKQLEETNQNYSIPIFVHYRTNRAVLDIPLHIRRKHKFSLLEAYDDALTGTTNFRHFFEWFRNREDLENEGRRHLDNQNPLLVDSSGLHIDKQLDAVRRALTMAMGDFSDLSVRRNPLKMTVKKLGKEIRVDQLSDGEKCMFAMIGDLARRLAIANPTMNEPLDGEGIALIDEIELHLHPSWQRMIVGKLCEIFPNCQFIITTHSPQTVGEVEARHLRVLTQNDNGEIQITTPNQSLGLDSAEILEEIMGGVPRRNKEVTKKLEEIDKLIDRENFAQAKNKIEQLKTELNGSIPAIVKQEGLITMLED